MTDMMLVTEKSKGFTSLLFTKEILILGGNKLRIAMTSEMLMMDSCVQ